ncbi:hypothetical protein V8E36_009765 [Tilletia maclaganii]
MPTDAQPSLLRTTPTTSTTTLPLTTTRKPSSSSQQPCRPSLSISPPTRTTPLARAHTTISARPDSTTTLRRECCSTTDASAPFSPSPACLPLPRASASSCPSLQRARRSHPRKANLMRAHLQHQHTTYRATRLCHPHRAQVKEQQRRSMRMVKVPSIEEFRAAKEAARAANRPKRTTRSMKPASFYSVTTNAASASRDQLPGR